MHVFHLSGWSRNDEQSVFTIDFQNETCRLTRSCLRSVPSSSMTSIPARRDWEKRTQHGFARFSIRIQVLLAMEQGVSWSVIERLLTSQLHPDTLHSRPLPGQPTVASRLVVIPFDEGHAVTIDRAFELIVGQKEQQAALDQGRAQNSNSSSALSHGLDKNHSGDHNHNHPHAHTHAHGHSHGLRHGGDVSMDDTNIDDDDLEDAGVDVPHADRLHAHDDMPLHRLPGLGDDLGHSGGEEDRGGSNADESEEEDEEEEEDATLTPDRASDPTTGSGVHVPLDGGHLGADDYAAHGHLDVSGED